MMQRHATYKVSLLRDSGVLIALILSSAYFTAFTLGVALAKLLGVTSDLGLGVPLIGATLKSIDVQVRLAVSEGARPDVIAYMVVLGAAVRSTVQVAASCIPLLPMLTLFGQGYLYPAYAAPTLTLETVALGLADSLSLGMVFGGLIALVRNERRRNLLAYGIMLQYVTSITSISYKVVGMILR